MASEQVALASESQTRRSETKTYQIRLYCSRRQRLFANPENVQTLFDGLDWLGRAQRFEIIFALAMPRTVFIVGQVQDEAVGSVVEALLRYVERRVKVHAAQGRQLWQDYYDTEQLRHESDIADAIQEIRYAPVRAGMVHRPEDYPYWRGEIESDDTGQPDQEL